MRLVIGFSLCFSIGCFSQDTKFVIKNNGGFVEEYYVLNSDNKIKEGKYVSYKSGVAGISLLASGTYRNGNKDGLWEHYHDVSVGMFSSFTRSNRSNSLSEKGHYVNGKKNGVWISYYLDTIANNTSVSKFASKDKIDSLNLFIEQRDLRPFMAGQYLNDKKVGEWISFDYSGAIVQKFNFSTSKLVFDRSLVDSLQYLNRPPLYVGGVGQLQRSFFREFDMKRIDSGIKKDTSTVIVEVPISEKGGVGEVKVMQNDAPPAIKKEVVRTVALLDNWIPARQDDHAVSGSYKLKFSIIRLREGTSIRTIRVNLVPF
jgi:antitoxin component YwqK of YwqJK toxin-antitoxin module